MEKNQDKSMGARIKMSDIARELAVSTVTVSKALTGKEGVGEPLRKRIKQKAAEMGYVYNDTSLHTPPGRLFNIGIIISSKYLGENSFYWIFFQKLLHTLKQTAYRGILEVIEQEDELNRSPPDLLNIRKVDGFIILGQFPDGYLSMIAARTRRCVFLDFYSDIGAYDCIASNNFAGSYNLTRLLIEAGHQKIRFIGSTSATTSILDRYMGFCKAMIEAGLSHGEAIDDRDRTGAYVEFPLGPEHTSAYVCNNDQLAGIVIDRLHRLNLRVPRDISLVGFDNESEVVTAGVGVTSLEVNVTAMCEMAVNLLLENIESDNYQIRGKVFIDGRVVVKESIAAPRVLT
jgi:LacI family transcriptional regulator